MSLRDWFAGMAPAPSEEDVAFQMRLDSARNPHNDPHKPRLREKLEIIALLRYRHADAMIAARAPDDPQAERGRGTGAQSDRSAAHRADGGDGPWP